MGTKYGYELNPMWNLPGSVLVSGIHLGYERNGIYPIEAVLSKIGNHQEPYDGDLISMRSHRYQVFSRSLTCVTCGLTGTYFAKERTLRRHSDEYQNKYSKWHFNLYAISFKPWREVLMTKDHIIPHSRGGTDTLDNYQTMCAPCNNRKGDGTTKVRKIHNISQEERWDSFHPKITATNIRLFKREFTAIFLKHLGWDPGDFAGCEERMSYNR